MPIKNISSIRRLPRVGKIHLGIKSVNAKGVEYPTKVDYFEVHETDNTPASVVEAFKGVYGDSPRALRIMFPTNDLEQIFPQWLKYYRKGIGLYCKGDGETAIRLTDSGDMAERECPCEFLESGHCKRVANLQFFLPDVPVLGVWQVDTSSYHSIVNINSGIDFICALTRGRIAMIPLTLRLKPQEVSPNGKKVTIYVLELSYEGLTLAKVLEAATQPLAALPVPVDDKETPEDLFPGVTGRTESVDIQTGEIQTSPLPTGEGAKSPSFPGGRTKGKPARGERCPEHKVFWGMKDGQYYHPIMDKKGKVGDCWYGGPQTVEPPEGPGSTMPSEAIEPGEMRFRTGEVETVAPRASPEADDEALEVLEEQERAEILQDILGNKNVLALPPPRRLHELQQRAEALGYNSRSLRKALEIPDDDSRLDEHIYNLETAWEVLKTHWGLNVA